MPLGGSDCRPLLNAETLPLPAIPGPQVAMAISMVSLCSCGPVTVCSCGRGPVQLCSCDCVLLWSGACAAVRLRLCAAVGLTVCSCGSMNVQLSARSPGLPFPCCPVARRCCPSPSPFGPCARTSLKCWPTRSEAPPSCRPPPTTSSLTPRSWPSTSWRWSSSRPTRWVGWGFLSFSFFL